MLIKADILIIYDILLIFNVSNNFKNYLKKNKLIFRKSSKLFARSPFNQIYHRFLTKSKMQQIDRKIRAFQRF